MIATNHRASKATGKKWQQKAASCVIQLILYYEEVKAITFKKGIRAQLMKLGRRCGAATILPID